VILAAVVLAAALLAGGIFTGIELARNRLLSTAAPTGRTPNSALTPQSAAAGAPGPATPLTPGCADVNAALASMSIRDKLAQLLMVGVTGAADARAVVTNQHVGGIFIGSWTDLSMFTDGSLTNIAGSAGPLRLAVSVDEEGGRVQRLSPLIGAAPSARVLAQTQTPDEVYQLALDRGRTMHDLGITVDFAPVVDVTDAPPYTVIGDRSFSADPAVVTAYAGAYARGLREAGVLPVLKHFPGHGRASGDSHPQAVVSPAGRPAGLRVGAVPHPGGAGPGGCDDRSSPGARFDAQRPRPAWARPLSIWCVTEPDTVAPAYMVPAVVPYIRWTRQRSICPTS